MQRRPCSTHQQEEIVTMTTNLESKKSAEPNDRTQSNAASGGTAWDATGRMGQAGLNGGEPGADAAVRTSSATAGVARIAGEPGWEAVVCGMRAMAEIQAHCAKASLDHGQRVLGTALQVVDMYREAVGLTAGSVQALTESCAHAGRGMQNWQQECFAQFRRSAAHLSATKQDFSWHRSSAEFVKVQRDIYVGAVNDLLRANTVFFDVAAKTAQTQATSLQEHAGMTA
jgi:hypothetical protein